MVLHPFRRIGDLMADNRRLLRPEAEPRSWDALAGPVHCAIRRTDADTSSCTPVLSGSLNCRRGRGTYAIGKTLPGHNVCTQDPAEDNQAVGQHQYDGVPGDHLSPFDDGLPHPDVAHRGQRVADGSEHDERRPEPP
jgi:hypothetical protein